MPAKTIAWIEAETEDLAPVVEPLRRAGFAIEPFANYAEARARMEELVRCDLLLLELLLPPGSARHDEDELLGRRLLQYIRHERKLRVPAIVLSVAAHTEKFDEAEAEAWQISLLAKPVRPSRLKAEVYRLLKLEEP
jgi:CheY-like chemotaxis protein